MARLQLSLACAGYDRTRALIDGRVQIDGVELVASVIEPDEAFHRAFKFGEFDISEISMSSHTMVTSRGENDYVCVPAFLSRVFRQSGIYVRTDRGIDRPADLRGRKIGLPEYQINCARFRAGSGTGLRRAGKPLTLGSRIDSIPKRRLTCPRSIASHMP